MGEPGAMPEQRLASEASNGSRFIPDRLEDIDASWLTSTLRANGVLREASVRGLRLEPLGEGAGFMGVMARVQLELDRPEAGAPTSLIAKLPTPVRKNRGLGELLGAYERELCFYTELAAEVPLRVPRIYYADFDRDPTSERQEQILRVVDRLPAPLLRASLPLGRWIATRKSRRYALLMEDLGSLRAGDQLAGGSPADCALALRALARAHAALWEDSRLEGRFWLTSPAIQSRSRHHLFRRSLPKFRSTFPELCRAGFDPLLDWLRGHGAVLLRRLHEDSPQTLLHGDARLDNLFFDRDANSEVVFIDWQLVCRGSAAYDVAYLLGGSLAADAAAAEERGLLELYHRELVSGGVKDYSFERLRRDYGRGLLACIQMLATIDQVDVGEARGSRMIERWLERLLLRAQPVSLEALLH